VGDEMRMGSNESNDGIKEEPEVESCAHTREFVQEVCKAYPTARVRKLADALNALGTAYETKLKDEGPADGAGAESYARALAAYDKSVQVAGWSGNQVDLARSYLSRGNLQRAAGQKEEAVADLEKSVKLVREGKTRTSPSYCTLSQRFDAAGRACCLTPRCGVGCVSARRFAPTDEVRVQGDGRLPVAARHLPVAVGEQDARGGDGARQEQHRVPLQARGHRLQQGWRLFWSHLEAAAG
jgi:hypothetical protein